MMDYRVNGLVNTWGFTGVMTNPTYRGYIYIYNSTSSDHDGANLCSKPLACLEGGLTPRQVPQDTAESILLWDVETGLVSVGCQNGYMPFMVKIFFANNTLFDSTPTVTVSPTIMVQWNVAIFERYSTY